MCFSLLRVHLFVWICDWYIFGAALHSTPCGSIQSYSCCKSDMFLFTTKSSNCWMWLLYNAHCRKVIHRKNNKAVFTTQLFMISFLCEGELMSSLDHLHHCFLIIYVMLLPRMIHAVRNRRIGLPDYTTFWAVCVAEWVKIRSISAVKC